ncbi:hypothetical protein Tco_1368199 [Tanacetum coccineum]
MTISSGSILLLVLLPFCGIPAKVSLETLFQSQRSLVRMIILSLLLVQLRSGKMDFLAIIQVANPTKVKVGERERAEEEARLLDSTVGRVVPLLQVAPAHVESELEASVERLFDEGGSVNQGDFAVGGGQEAGTELVTGVRIIANENVVAERPKRPCKKRQAVTNASSSSHPLKKLKGDHRTSSGATTGGKSPSALRELLANSSHHSSTNAADAGIDSFVRSVAPPPVMTEAVITTNVASIPSASAPVTGTKVISPVHASMFHDSDFTGTVKPNAAGSSHIPGEDLSMGSQDINSETLHEVFVSQWNISNDTLLDDHDVSREFIDHLAPPVLFSQIREMDYHHLFMEFNIRTSHQACLNAEVRMRTEYCLSERRRLESECEKQDDLLKARDAEVESLKAQLLLKETEVAKAAHLRAQVSAAEATEKIHTNEIDALKQRNVALKNEKESLDGKKDDRVDQVHALETTCSGLHDQVSGYERLKEQIEEFQDVQMNIVNDKVAKLDADLLEMALHLEEKFYPHLLTTISGRRWLLTYGLKLVVVKCLNSQEYLSALGAAINHTTEKGMQDGLSPAIDHGKVGRSLADVVAYNSAAEADYKSAIQRLREPNVDQLMLPIHRSEDHVVLCETSLSFSLSVTHSRVKRIRENVTAKRSALIGVWTPLVDPLSVEKLVGEAGTSNSVPATVATTTALSTTFASASSVPPITIEDYEIVGTDGPEDA